MGNHVCCAEELLSRSARPEQRDVRYSDCGHQVFQNDKRLWSTLGPILDPECFRKLEWQNCQPCKIGHRVRGSWNTGTPKGSRTMRRANGRGVAPGETFKISQIFDST